MFKSSAIQIALFLLNTLFLGLSRLPSLDSGRVWPLNTNNFPRSVSLDTSPESFHTVLFKLIGKNNFLECRVASIYFVPSEFVETRINL
jgi:hypothetical protein